MEPLELVGWKKFESKNQNIYIRLYCTRHVDSSSDGFLDGSGKEVVTHYFNPEYCKYDPKIGDLIIPVVGKYGLDSVYVIGSVVNG